MVDIEKIDRDLTRAVAELLNHEARLTAIETFLRDLYHEFLAGSGLTPREEKLLALLTAWITTSKVSGVRPAN